MLSREELKEMAKIHTDGSMFVSLYLNVNPAMNIKNNYMIHVKNMLKQTFETLDKSILKKIGKDLGKIESYIKTNKKIFKNGLALISCHEKGFWKEFHLAVPVKNEIIIDKTPYIKPLLDILDNYQRYAILLVGRDVARFFIIHLGEIEEYSELYTKDVPGRHKKGGWFALAEKSYERHIDYHVNLHLKDVLKQMETFLSREYVGRLIIGGSEEAVTKVKTMLPSNIAEKLIGTFQADMQAGTKDILKKVKPIFQEVEKKKEDADVEELLTKAMKNENAVIGIEDVLLALQEGRIMKLIVLKDFKHSGKSCKECGYLMIQSVASCPYCKGEIEEVNYIVDLIAQKSIEQGALVEVISKNRKLQDAGNIGAFLRF